MHMHADSHVKTHIFIRKNAYKSTYGHHMARKNTCKYAHACRFTRKTRKNRVLGNQKNGQKSIIG